MTIFIWNVNVNSEGRTVMVYWQITKYAPDHDAGEWTSISDVGSVCAGKLLTMDEYLRTEELYLNAVALLARRNQVSAFEIAGMELHREVPPDLTIYENGQLIDLKSALVLARHILREELWCQLVSPRMVVRFGYDYYMYIGSASASNLERKEIEAFGLYVKEVF